MKKGLIAVLIAANLLMLVIGILIIPPNLPSAAGKESPAVRIEQTAPATPSPEEQTPPAATESGSIPAPEETGVNLSTEERPDLGDFLWYTEDVAYDGVPSDANIIDNISPLTGSWKALIIYDPNNEYDAGAMEFLNVALAGAAANHRQKAPRPPNRAMLPPARRERMKTGITASARRPSMRSTE